jgi:hypothetical protein
MAYPNPASDYLTIAWNPGSDERAAITVTDITGRILRVQQFGGLVKDNNNIRQLPLTGLSKGIYILQIRGTSDLKTIRFAVR